MLTTATPTEVEAASLSPPGDSEMYRMTASL